MARLAKEQQKEVPPGNEEDAQASKYRPCAPSQETQYEQLFIEMRRYRDHEQWVATWYTTILVAIVAAVISMSTRGNPQPIIIGNKVFLASMLLLLSVSMTYLIWYTNGRYHELRRHTDKCFDHYLSKTCLQPREPLIRGHIATLTPLWILTVAFWVVLFCFVK